jgi:hypothetical protein
MWSSRSEDRGRYPESNLLADRDRPQTVPSPVDRGRRGSKHYLLVDAGGIPLAWMLTGGNRNDVTQLLALLDRAPGVRRRRTPFRRRAQSQACVRDL